MRKLENITWYNLLYTSNFLSYAMAMSPSSAEIDWRTMQCTHSLYYFSRSLSGIMDEEVALTFILFHAGHVTISSRLSPQAEVWTRYGGLSSHSRPRACMAMNNMNKSSEKQVRVPKLDCTWISEAHLSPKIWRSDLIKCSASLGKSLAKYDWRNPSDVNGFSCWGSDCTKSPT